MTIDNLKSPDLAARPGPGHRRHGHSPAGQDLLRVDDLQISVHHGAATAIRGVSLGIRPGRSSAWSGSRAAARP